MSKDTKFIITEDQFESIEHFKSMFEVNADTILEMCNSEKPDIVYGFELGKIHSHLRECYFDMGQLEEAIEHQEIIEKELEIFDPEQEAIDFTESSFSKVGSLLPEDYKIGFKEGIERYLIHKSMAK